MGGGKDHLGGVSRSSEVIQPPSSLVWERLKHLKDALTTSGEEKVVEVDLGLTGVHIDGIPNQLPLVESRGVFPGGDINPVKAKGPGRMGPLSLEIAMRAYFQYGKMMTLKALIDTGAQVSLINRRLVGPECWDANVPPIRFRAANQTCLPGGDQAVHVNVRIMGVNEDLGTFALYFLALLYGAEIQAYMILSYTCLTQHVMAVVA